MTSGMTHELKIWPVFFNAVVNGKKSFEIRKMDRDYQCGDFIRLREYLNEERDYSGRECTCLITYIYRSNDFMLNGHGVLSIKLIGDKNTHKAISNFETTYEKDAQALVLVSKVRDLDHQVQTDRFFRQHLSTELDKLSLKLNPLLRADLEKILIKLRAKAEYDF